MWDRTLLIALVTWLMAMGFYPFVHGITTGLDGVSQNMSLEGGHDELVAGSGLPFSDSFLRPYLEPTSSRDTSTVPSTSLRLANLDGKSPQGLTESIPIVHGNAKLTIAPVSNSTDSIQTALESLDKGARKHAQRRFLVSMDQWQTAFVGLFRELSSSRDQLPADNIARAQEAFRKWGSTEGEMTGSVRGELIEKLIKRDYPILQPLFSVAKSTMLDREGRLPIHVVWRYNPSGFLDVVVLEPPPPPAFFRASGYNFAFSLVETLISGEPIRDPDPEPTKPWQSGAD